MRLILTYRGPLRGNSSKAAHKNDIRKQLHAQLRNFWASHPDLRSFTTDGGFFGKQFSETKSFEQACAEEISCDGVHFVPLSTRALKLNVSLRVKLLVKPNSATLVPKGDIDNRMKTLLDGLRMPLQKTEISQEIRSFTSTRPLYVLMQDDDMVQSLEVRYDTLLDFEPKSTEKDEVFAFIEADVFPTSAMQKTIRFLGNH